MQQLPGLRLNQWITTSTPCLQMTVSTLHQEPSPPKLPIATTTNTRINKSTKCQLLQDRISCATMHASALWGCLLLVVLGAARELGVPTATANKWKLIAPTISAPPRKNTQRVVRTVSSSDSCSPQSFNENLEEISTVSGYLRYSTEGYAIYPPNTKMNNFNRRIIIFVHNFVPSNDESILPSCFFTLNKRGNPIRGYGWCYSMSLGNVIKYTIPTSSRMLI